jgi:hypothetical protein
LIAKVKNLYTTSGSYHKKMFIFQIHCKIDVSRQNYSLHTSNLR